MIVLRRGTLGQLGWTVLALCGAMLAASCSKSGPVSSDLRSAAGSTRATASTAPAGAACGEAVAGLRVCLEVPPGTARVGDSVQVTLWFRNDGSSPLRIYLLRSEPFRFSQSTLYVRRPDSTELVSVQPQPRPHGITVTEEDFHLIEPGRELAFRQTLHLPEAKFRGGGSFRVTWRYENEVEQWKGGVKTLDGPTKELFGGKRIEHIWLGTIEASAPLEAAP